jgi:hypothetical protein
MAVRTWDYGGASGDWQTAANWSDDTVPLADDEVIFDGTSVVLPTEGMLDSESGATAQCTYDLLHFKSTYTGGVASAAEPLCCSPDKLIIEGSGTYHILCGKDDQSTDTTIPITIINNKSAIVYLYSNCNDGANLCEFTDVYLIAGTLYVSYYEVDTDDQGCYIKNLYMAPTSNNSTYATVDFTQDCYDVLNSVPTNVYMQNGTLTADCQLGTFVMYSGATTFGDSASAETDLDITILRLYGGTFTWQPNETDATITAAHLFGGTFDSSGTTNASAAKTITTAYLYQGSTLNIANNRGNITVTNLYRMGGTLTVDKNSKIAITYNQP